MSGDLPLISCICITFRRVVSLCKAIDCFKSQDYKNKELVICYSIDDLISNFIIDKYASKHNIKIQKISRSPDITLGDARNLAINVAHGDYICVWDDDDWYHPTRLSVQLSYILDGRYLACVLNQIILFEKASHQAYLSFLYTWEGTLLCHHDTFLKYQYQPKFNGEDSNLIDVLDANSELVHISNVPFLYIYIIHGENSSGMGHFKSFIRRSYSLGSDISNAISSLVL